MIGFVNGEIEDIYEDRILVDCGFMGYNIFVPGNVTDYCNIGEEIKLYTYLSVREDAMNLFGFMSKDELNIFKMLITVNGIGPKGALSVLTMLSPNELRIAVASEDVKLINKVPGIGPKTAQKLILELKDKLNIEDIIIGSSEDNMDVLSGTGMSSSNTMEAVEVLVALGYSQSESLKAVKSLDITEHMDTEEIVKLALKKI